MHGEIRGIGAELGVSLCLGPVHSVSSVVADCVAIGARLVSEHPSALPAAHYGHTGLMSKQTRKAKPNLTVALLPATEL